MHEMSIVEALLESVEQQLASYPGARATTLTVRIGALRLVEPATLRFCFQTVAPDVRLEIEEVAASARCCDCQKTFSIEENWFQCPHCQSVNGQILTGNELQLVSLEIEPAIPALTNCLT